MYIIKRKERPVSMPPECLRLPSDLTGLLMRTKASLPVVAAANAAPPGAPLFSHRR